MFDNNFSYLHKSMNLITDKHGIISLEDLWDKYYGNIEVGECDISSLPDLQLLDKDGWTKLLNIKKYRKEESFKMMFLSIKSGQFIICQDEYVHILSDKDEVPSYLKNTVLKNIASYDKYRACITKDVARYFGNEDDLIKKLIDILNKEKLEINRNVVTFSTKSIDCIGQLMLIMNYFDISIRIIPSLEKTKRSQLFNVTFSPTETQRFYFDDCKQMNKFRFLPNQYINKHIENISIYKEICVDDDYVYELFTESSTLILNGIWEHDSTSKTLG